MARPVLRSDNELFAGSYLLALAKDEKMLLNDGSGR